MVLVPLGLSGCVKLDMDLKVRADNLVDGTVIIAIDKRVLDIGGQSESGVRKQLEFQGPFSGSDRPSKGSFAQHPYQAGGRQPSRRALPGLTPPSHFR